MEQIITLLIGGLIGAFFKYASDVLKGITDTQNQAYATLMKDRWEHYQRLWSISGEVSQWPRNESLSLESVGDMSSRLRQWYFGKGGMMLSKNAREKYTPVQKALQAIYQKTADKTTLVNEEDYKLIRERFSDLRSELTQDLMSRKRQMLS